MSGNGYVDQGFNFGIGIVNGSDNVVVDNVVTGNTNGIIVFPGVVGNLIRRNLVVGNPPVQVSVDHPGTTGVDIRNLAPDTNTLDDNICLTGENAACPNVDGTPMRLPG
jgi:parallel beta-helix repeat protein